MKKIAREDALMLLQSKELGNGNLDDRSDDQLADMIDTHMQAEDTTPDDEFEDAGVGEIFGRLCDIYEDGDTIEVVSEEAETPKKKKVAAKKTKAAPVEEEESDEEPGKAKPTKKAAAKKTAPAKKVLAKKVAAEKPTKPVKKTPTEKSSRGPKKLGKLSGVDAAYELLKEEKQIMTAAEIYTLLAKRGIWKSRAATPAATLGSKMIMECISKGEQSRFERPDRGLFKAAGVKCPAREPEPRKTLFKKAAVEKKPVEKTAAKKTPAKKVAAKKK